MSTMEISEHSISDPREPDSSQTDTSDSSDDVVRTGEGSSQDDYDTNAG